MATKTSFSCGESLDIVNANSLVTRLLKAMEKSSTIELKADKVTKSDTAGLQVMVALKQEVSKTGGKLIWKNPSETLKNNAKKLGLYQILEISE